MHFIHPDFISREPRRFRMGLGGPIASALSGFVAGVLVASIIFLAGIYVLTLFTAAQN